MQFLTLFRVLAVLVTCNAAPYLQHMPRSTASPGRAASPSGVGLDLSPTLIRLERQVDGSEWQMSEDAAEASMGTNGTDPEHGQMQAESSAAPSMEQPAELSAPSDPQASSSAPAATDMSTTSSFSSTSVATAGPTSTAAPANPSPSAMAMSVPPSTSSASMTYSYTSFMPSMTSSASVTSSANITTASASAQSNSTSSSSSSPAASSATGNVTLKAASEGEEHSKKNEKAKKIRYKQCPSTGTVSDIKVTPCEGGKGTILDPCQFHAGSNYTIELSFVTPLDSPHPRSNLIARDRSLSNGPGSEDFPYSGQSFDACAYTKCPIPANTSSLYTYEFVTLNDRFDQLTFNVTDGFEGPSMFCTYFPVTFVPNVVSRSLRLPFAGLGPRGPK